MSKHFFLHIPKCGGSTIRQYYRRSFSQVLVIQRGPRGDMTSAEFAGSSDVLQYDAIVGHLNLHHFLANLEVRSYKGEFIVHSVVRDPIDRLISYYNFVRFNKSHPEHNVCRDMDGVVFAMRSSPNIQAKYLGVGQQFSTAKQVTRSINLICLEKSIERMRDYFTSYCGEAISSVERANVTSQNFVRKGDKMLSRRDFSSSQIMELMDKHAVDLELYEASQLLQPTCNLALRDLVG